MMAPSDHHALTLAGAAAVRVRGALSAVGPCGLTIVVTQDNRWSVTAVIERDVTGAPLGTAHLPLIEAALRPLGFRRPTGPEAGLPGAGTAWWVATTGRNNVAVGACLGGAR